MTRLASGAFALGIIAVSLTTSSCGSSSPQQASPVRPKTKIAAGGGHTCSLTSDGGVKCWGFNEAGQLGDGTTAPHVTPVAVSGLTTGVAAVAAGSDHTCALTSTGGVKCWGWNEFGQLGDGTKISRRGPVNVSGLESKAIAITAGDMHTCALTAAGAVKCWGANDSGQLGDDRGCGNACLTPVAVSGLDRDVTAVSSGRTHTCVLTHAGGVTCWGANCCAQLGDGTRAQRNVPVPVSGLAAGVTAITAGGSHTCALTKTRAVKCWGWNKSGQVGDGTRADRAEPVAVSGLSSDVTSVEAGDTHTCAVTRMGAVVCWGANDSGQLGNGGSAAQTTPDEVSGLESGVAAVTAWNQTCALTVTGNLKCWGYNYDGEVGDGTRTDRHAPVGVIGFQ